MRQVTPATPMRVVGGRGDRAGDVRAVEAPALGGARAIAGIEGIGIGAVAVVRATRVGDEVESRDQPSREVGMIAPDPGVDDGDHRVGATDRHVPRPR